VAKTLGFYRNFQLSLDRLSGALRCVKEDPTASQEQLAAYLGANVPVGKGFSAWLRHTGLVEAESEDAWQALQYSLTPFGRLASEYDPLLADPGTQWLLHYYLATEHAERSDAWRLLINHFISPGLSFTAEQFGRYCMDTLGREATNRAALQKDPQAALNTYVRPTVLGRLGVLTYDSGTYTVGRPDLPDTLVVGYVLFDRWQWAHPDTDTLRFSLLCQEVDNVGRIFVAEPSQIRRVLSDLAGRGYLTFSETQHEPVNRLHHGPPAVLLERHYKTRWTS
jgi:hypothetical protein